MSFMPNRWNCYSIIYLLSILLHAGCMPEHIKLPTTEETEKSHFHAVDLGLSVMWACCNVGADNPWERGEQYAWGQTDLNTGYDSDTNIGSEISGTHYDVVHIKWKGNWRMPTKEEIDELCDKCFWEWTSVNSIKGYLVIGPNRNSIFLPITGDNSYSPSGDYWSGSINNMYGLNFFAYNLTFDELVQYSSYSLRSNEFSIRPVRD